MKTYSLLLCFALLVGCGPSITPPQGYIKLKDSYYHDFKAVSAQGHTIVVNEHENEDKRADLDFWTAALEYQKIDLDGLVLVDRVAIRAQKEGVNGTMFQFLVGDPPNQLLYFVGLYVTPNDIYTLQAVGPREVMEPQNDAIKRSFESIEF